MKIGIQKVACALALISLAAALPAQEAKLVYLEGEVDVKTSAGGMLVPDPGESIRTGDTLITGRSGFAELHKTDGTMIAVQPDTVFRILETESGGRKESVLSASLGAAAFRFDSLTGRAARVATGSAIVRIRGTEFTVYAGADGSSMILVDDGRVAVEAEGVTVELAEKEAVEVRPGLPPGEEFSLLTGTIAFSDWNRQRTEFMLAAPVHAVLQLERRMRAFAHEMHRYEELYEKLEERLKAEREKLKEIRNADAREKHEEETVIPLTARTRSAYLNIRYCTLSAYSLRRDVLSRLYFMIKTRYITQPNHPIYRDFADAFGRVTDYFTSEFGRYLDERDI